MLFSISISTLPMLLPLIFSAITLASPPDNATMRRGISYNKPELVQYFFHAGSNVSWIYNWDSNSVGTHTSYEYIPSLHSLRPEYTQKWAADVESAVGVWESNPTHLLGFGEPDNCADGAGGTCITVADAVTGWKTYMQPTKSLKSLMYLGSPCVSSAQGENIGLDWLSKFLDACTGCDVDFLCIHWYGDATNPTAFKTYINATRAISQGRPIWVTEFAVWGKDEDTKTFLDDVLPFMEGTDYVHRYAYFMAREGHLINGDGNGLSEIGKYYAEWQSNGPEIEKLAGPKKRAVEGEERGWMG